MLEACPNIDVLSTTIPLVEPALFAGVGAVLVTAAGGHAGLPVTLMEITQPALLIPQAPPTGIGAALAARFPMLKKIQSLSTPDSPPLGLSNSVTGEHASALPVTSPPSSVPTPERTPVAAVKLS
jgi:hypothetical protein